MSAIAILAVIMAGLGFASAQAAPAATPDSYSIWPSSATPRQSSDSDTHATEVGVQFTSETAGKVSAIEFYGSDDNTGPHVGHLWSSDGQALASVTFGSSDSQGWHTATLAAPVSIRADTVYTASYLAPHGHYADDVNSLGEGKTVTNGDLTALRGVYDYDSATNMPKSTWNASNYYVDVVFTPNAATSGGSATSAPPTTAPTSTTPTTTAPPAPTTTAPTTQAPPPPAPGAAAFASAATTGANESTAFKVVDGDYHAKTAGATVENLDIRGALYVEAANVTVRNVKVTCSNSWWIVQAKAPGLTITDSTLTVDRSKSTNYCQYGITAGDDAKIYRNDISNTPDGLTFSGDSAEVVGNWVHNQIAYPGKSDHVDAAQLNGGGSGPYVFRGNFFSVPEQQTGCLSLFADFGSIRNVLADGNLFDGAGYSVYGGTSSATNVRFTNNMFGTTFSSRGGYFGPVTAFNPNGSGNVWSNNRWLATGVVINAGG